MTKTTVGHPALESWDALNEAIMQMDETEVAELLKTELKHRARPTFTKRIHARLNKVRADRERAELAEKFR